MLLHETTTTITIMVIIITTVAAAGESDDDHQTTIKRIMQQQQQQRKYFLLIVFVHQFSHSLLARPGTMPSILSSQYLWHLWTMCLKSPYILQLSNSTNHPETGDPASLGNGGSGLFHQARGPIWINFRNVGWNSCLHSDSCKHLPQCPWAS